MSKIQNEIRVNIPKWLTVLDYENPVIAHVIEGVRKFAKQGTTEKVFDKSPYFTSITKTSAEGETPTFEVIAQDNLYYKVLTELTGTTIGTEADLLGYVSGVADKKQTLDKFQDAMEQMEKSGYGVVSPNYTEFDLQKPELFKSGKSFGVKLRASGQSIHLIKVDINCEVAPIIGEQGQSEEMLKFLQNEYETNRQTVWETPIFGKSLESIVREDIENKATSMPVLAKTKVQKTLGRIVNNGKGGVICILL